QRAEQFILFGGGDIEFIQGLDQIFDQGVELACRHPHVFVGGFHIQACVTAGAACSETDECFEVGDQSCRVALGEFLVDAIVREHVPSEVLDHGGNRLFTSQSLKER